MLEVVCRATAPLLPLTTEEVWRGLTGGRSVHLTDWPARPADELPADDALVAAMDQVREVCSVDLVAAQGRAAAQPAAAGHADRRRRRPRGAGRLRRRSSPTRSTSRRCACSPPTRPEAASYGVAQRLTVNARAAGPRLGKDVQRAIKASKSGDWSVADDGTVTAGGLALVEGEYTLETVAGADRRRHRASACCPAAGSWCSTPRVTPELAAEGLARDLVRAVQQARRDAGLDVSDRIALRVGGSDGVRAAARAHERADRRRDPGDVVRRGGAR